MSLERQIKLNLKFQYCDCLEFQKQKQTEYRPVRLAQWLENNLKHANVLPFSCDIVCHYRLDWWLGIKWGLIQSKVIYVDSGVGKTRRAAPRNLAWLFHHLFYILYASNDLEVSLRSRYLRSTVDLDLIRSSYTYFDAYQRTDLDGTATFPLAWSIQKLLAKHLSCPPVPLFWLSYPCDVFFIWPQNDLCKSCRSCSLAFNAVYRLTLACFVLEIGEQICPPPPLSRRGEVGPDPRRCAG